MDGRSSTPFCTDGNPGIVIFMRSKIVDKVRKIDPIRV